MQVPSGIFSAKFSVKILTKYKIHAHVSKEGFPPLCKHTSWVVYTHQFGLALNGLKVSNQIPPVIVHLYQAVTTCGSLAARLQGSGERMRKWRKMRKWREGERKWR